MKQHTEPIEHAELHWMTNGYKSPKKKDGGEVDIATSPLTEKVRNAGFVKAKSSKFRLPVGGSTIALHAKVEFKIHINCPPPTNALGVQILNHSSNTGTLIKTLVWMHP